jgi:hypothetical protein
MFIQSVSGNEWHRWLEQHNLDRAHRIRPTSSLQTRQCFRNWSSILLNTDFSTSNSENSACDIRWVQVTRPGSKKLHSYCTVRLSYLRLCGTLRTRSRHASVGSTRATHRGWNMQSYLKHWRYYSFLKEKTSILTEVVPILAIQHWQMNKLWLKK